ncbi:hypothetical protein SAMN05443633_104102 [Chryseobacterium arachidis]|uniref:Uncharacterized protein n=1 Tax=Chryseobacterium arachidis TaxID=1416778 RepID=A0A1M5BAG8_9FLAO|nr:hypothetical protein [Chryseobacterium arachidis]SHF39503.1 hypothetical protein SAMN05443633_104102 [Chryseobacterium arachidis]
MNNNTLNKLKSDYEELEIKPSSDLWDRLDEKLDEAAEISLKQSFQWWKYAAVVLLLISVGTVIYFVNKDDQETDFIVKKRLEKTVHPINPDIQNQPVKSNDQLIQPAENNKLVVSTENKKKNIQPEEKIEIVLQCYPSEIKNQLLVQEEKIIKNIPDTNPVIQTKIDEKPVLAEKKKISYINAEELLLGREFDKTREEAKKDEKKFGVFNVNKVFKKVENVTVLGVTVYSEPK